jgi:hypothetical protein
MGYEEFDCIANDPNTHKLDALGSLNRQLRLDDYEGYSFN